MTNQRCKHFLDCQSCCRYILAFNVPEVGEKVLLLGSMTKGIVSEEAMAVEGPMIQELGLMEALHKPGAATAGLNWYRYANEASQNMHCRGELWKRHCRKVVQKTL